MVSMNKMGGKSYLFCKVFLLILGYEVMMITSASDIEKDKQECATQLVGLATCITYVGGTAKAPTPDCCTGLKEVVAKSKKCLCVLVNDRNDKSLGIKVNATLALGLPNICKSPTNIGECPKLLNLAPNSPEAKVFQEFAKGSLNTTAPATSTGNPKNTSGGG